MEEFLAPKEVNTGMEVLEAEGFSETGLEVSFDPLISLDGLVAWKKTGVRGQRGRESLHAGSQLKCVKNEKPPQTQEKISYKWKKLEGIWGQGQEVGATAGAERGRCIGLDQRTWKLGGRIGLWLLIGERRWKREREVQGDHAQGGQTGIEEGSGEGRGERKSEMLAATGV